MLSRNDTGETGGHQAGILVPKDPEVLAFFPLLDTSEKNPRHIMTFGDNFGDKWTFAFIYYNNAFFGGTRNEYRLTRMTPYLRRHNLKSGDTITLHRSQDGIYTITYRRLRETQQSTDGTLKLGTNWKVVPI
jgi:hypothetical protein